MSKKTIEKAEMTIVGKILTDTPEFKSKMGVVSVADTMPLNLDQKLEIVRWNAAVDAVRIAAFDIHISRMAKTAADEWGDPEELRDALFSAISAVYSIIGPIGQGKMTGASTVYEWAVNNSFVNKDIKHGETLRLSSEQANDNKALKDALAAPNGVNAEYISAIQARMDKRAARLKELSTVYGEISSRPVEKGLKAFEIEFSKYVAAIATRQKTLTLDEYKSLKKAEKDAVNASKKAAK